MTAEEFLDNLSNEAYIDDVSNKIYFPSQVEEAMIEFAKYHVQEALEVASEKGCDSLELYNSEYETLKKSVKEAYPLNNIK